VESIIGFSRPGLDLDHDGGGLGELGVPAVDDIIEAA